MVRFDICAMHALCKNFVYMYRCGVCMCMYVCICVCVYVCMCTLLGSSYNMC